MLDGEVTLARFRHGGVGRGLAVEVGPDHGGGAGPQAGPLAGNEAGSLTPAGQFAQALPVYEAVLCLSFQEPLKS